MQIGPAVFCERNKERNKQRKTNRPKTIPRPPTGGGVIICTVNKGSICTVSKNHALRWDFEPFLQESALIAKAK